MADDNNPVNKTNQPTTPQMQSTTQSRTRRSSRLGDDPLTDSVRNLISQFDASGARRPEELDQIEQAINESQRILTELIQVLLDASLLSYLSVRLPVLAPVILYLLWENNSCL